jgi:Ca2+-binding RTX toxin-like protein
LTVNPGAYNYLAVGENAIIEYSYTIEDGNGGSVAQTATITIEGRNDGPIATDVSFLVSEDGSITGNLLAGANDPDTTDSLNVVSIATASASAVAGEDLITANGVVTLHGDGTFTYTPGIGCGATSDSFTYSISDGNGGTATATVNIAIHQYAGVSLQSGALRVGGGDDADIVTVSGGNLVVNGVPHSLHGVSEIRIWGRDGNDTIDLSGWNLPAFIHGGDGNDNLTGGAANDVIFGGTGDDHITGGAGHDFLIGDDGKDRIVGAAGHDILVAGDVACYLDLIALRAASEAWSSSREIFAETDDNDVLDEIFGDDDFDQLTGSAGADLFFIDSGDKITDFQFGKPKTNRDGDVVFINGVQVS